MADKPRIVEDIQRELLAREPRDGEGLTAPQRKFLARRVYTFSDKAALDEIGAELLDIYKWRNEPAFRVAYDALVPKVTVEDAKKDLGQLLIDCVTTITNALKGEEVTKSQRWAVERVFKAFGMEKLIIETTHTNIPFEARLALEMARRGLALPPAFTDLMLQYYPEDYKALEEAPSTGRTSTETTELSGRPRQAPVEAEFRELPPPETT